MNNKPILIFSHDECETPGYLETLLERMQIAYKSVCLYEGVELPRQIEDIGGMIIMGGAGNVNEPTDTMLQEMTLIRQADQQGIPVLGICLGAQLMSKALGGEVWPSIQMEIGWHPVSINEEQRNHPWLLDLPATFDVFQWHAHEFSPPPGAECFASSDCTDCQGFIAGRHLALQFHLEMTENMINTLLERYASDLEHTSRCVQSADQIRSVMPGRCSAVFEIANVLFTRWFEQSLN